MSGHHDDAYPSLHAKDFGKTLNGKFLANVFSVLVHSSITDAEAISDFLAVKTGLDQMEDLGFAGGKQV